MTRVAVVGHVEWVDFLTVAGLPRHGQITRAERVRANAGGGAVVAAVVLAGLGAEVDFFGAVGADELGDRAESELAGHGISTHLARREATTRQVITFLDAGHERSIVVIGERLAPHGDDPLPWERIAEADAAYVTAGDGAALGRARQARYLTATPRIAENLPATGPGVTLDALIYSADDDAEVAWAARLADTAKLRVITEGERGGRIEGDGDPLRWATVAPPGPVIDAYGAGDSFAAGFTFGVATGASPLAAAELGAACGARALTHAGGP